MENTIIDARRYLLKSLEESGVNLSEEQLKTITNVMYYYTKECNITSSHSKLSDDDIEMIYRESKLSIEELELMKGILHKIFLSQDVIKKLTQL